MNREQWLTDGANALLETLFKPLGYAMPIFRVTCGFPSVGALSARKRTIGQCWSAKASADGTVEIMISPVVSDPVEALAILAHELVHGVVGNECGHKGPFRTAALAIGLIGKMTETTPGEKFRETAQSIVSKLGAYPHAQLDHTNRKKQTTRLLKCECPKCGYTARVTRKWLELGAPICPIDQIPLDAV